MKGLNKMHHSQLAGIIAVPIIAGILLVNSPYVAANDANAPSFIEVVSYNFSLSSLTVREVEKYYFSDGGYGLSVALDPLVGKRLNDALRVLENPSLTVVLNGKFVGINIPVHFMEGNEIDWSVGFIISPLTKEQMDAGFLALGGIE